MRKLKLFLGMAVMLVALAGVAIQAPANSGGDPVPLCPPDGCVIAN